MQGKHDLTEYVLPAVFVPFSRLRRDSVSDTRTMQAPPAESGLDKNRCGCGPVPDPRGNPKKGTQQLLETAGSGFAGTVCDQPGRFLREQVH